MPRNGSGVMSWPANTDGGPSGTPISSVKFNTRMSDLLADLNNARPVTAGGTGATNFTDALANLNAVQQSGGTGQIAAKLYLGLDSSFGFARLQSNTTDFGRIWQDVEGGRSIANPGYQRIPGGLIIQWGSVATSIVSTNIIPLNWPITFPNAFLTCVAFNGDASNGPGEVCSVSLASVSGVNVQFTPSPGTGALRRVNYIALGR